LTGLPSYVPFAVYRIQFSTGDTIRLFAGFWDTDGDGTWNVPVVDGEYDWETPVFGAPSYEPIYCFQGYDAAGNEISYDPANHAVYEAADGGTGWLGDPDVANTTWGGGTGEFHYPVITATMFGMYFGVGDGGSELPYGQIVWFGTNKANSGQDKFTFSTTGTTATDSALVATVENVNVYPNPYYARNENADSRFDNFVTFTHLPKLAEIKIFTIDGSHVVTLNKEDDGSQFLDWNLQNAYNLPVASGAYIAYIDMDSNSPKLGTKVLKLFVVQSKQIVQYY